VGGIDLGFKSNLIAAGEGYIWVIDPRGSTLVKIDPASHEIVDTIGIAVDAGAIPFGLAVGDGAVWVAVVRGSSEALDGGSFAVVLAVADEAQRAHVTVSSEGLGRVRRVSS
jgi:streptogramin lyase